VNTLPISGDGGLLSVLEALTDPRKKRGIRHKVAAILTMVAAATLAGHRSFRSVADFVANLPSDALARLGARQDRLTGRCVAPSEPTCGECRRRCHQSCWGLFLLVSGHDDLTDPITS